LFTNEFEFGATVTTILDDSGEHEDLEVIIDDNGVFFRQWNDAHERYDLILISHKMFGEFLMAMKKPEGAYKIYFEKK
jgi:hypothetical protein